jgi:hypothetical protein
MINYLAQILKFKPYSTVAPPATAHSITITCPVATTPSIGVPSYNGVDVTFDYPN